MKNMKRIPEHYGAQWKYCSSMSQPEDNRDTVDFFLQNCSLITILCNAMSISVTISTINRKKNKWVSPGDAAMPTGI